MKVVILAGGFGTRISEESQFKPKPMIEIGGKPILWHIMKWYSKFGHTEFIICCGYKQQVIKNYFAFLSVKFQNTKLVSNCGLSKSQTNSRRFLSHAIFCDELRDRFGFFKKVQVTTLDILYKCNDLRTFLCGIDKYTRH